MAATLLITAFALSVCTVEAVANESFERSRGPSDKMRTYESLVSSFHAHESAVLGSFTGGMATAMSLHLAKSHPGLIRSASTMEIVHLSQTWDAHAEKWEDEERSYHYSDQAGRITEIGFQSFEDGQWINEFRMLMEYEGTSNNVSILVSQGWDKEDNDWYYNEYRSRFVSYNEFGYPLEVIYEEWFNNEWDQWERDVISYVDHTKYDVIRNYYWDLTSWLLEGRESWTYQDGHVTRILLEYGDSEDEMEPSERELFEYDRSWNNILWEWQLYEDDWVGYFRNVMTYQDNLLQEEVYQIWSETEDVEGDWMGIMKTVYDEYDSHGNIIIETDYIFLFDDWHGSMRSIHNYDRDDRLMVTTRYGWSGADWLKVGRTLYSGMIPSHADETVQLPLETKLYQNYPNPFNPSTTIRFTIPERVHVEITVFNALGQMVGRLVDREMEAGRHDVVFDASLLPSGAYIYRLNAGSHVESRKLMLLK